MENNINKSQNNSTNTRNTVWAVIVILVIIGIGWWLYTKNKTTETVPTTTEQQQDETVLDGIEDTTDGSITANATPGAVSLSYKQALVAYKDTRIQLGNGNACTATPRTMTFKSGTTIMVDNRAPVARTVKIGSNYSVKAYGFKLIKLSSSTLPVTYLVDCNNQQNVATILLQK